MATCAVGFPSQKPGYGLCREKGAKIKIMGKKTLVLGATTRTDRYSNRAVRNLWRAGHEVVPVGIDPGDIEGVPILHGKPPLENIDTVTLYLRPERQKEFYQYIFDLHPKRIIFNPGTENPELERLAIQNGIEPVVGCTLVMLSINTY